MKVLVVEDHQGTRSALTRLLSRWGYQVAEAGDVKGGLGYLNRDHFDAIVSDIALPDGTGYAMMNQARNEGVDSLAIAISAFPYPPDVNEPKVTGFDEHLDKPLAADQLRRALEHRLAHA